MVTPADSLHEEITLRGSVAHLFFQSPTFSAGILQCANKEKVKFSGKFMVSAGDEVSLIGQWAQHPQYGLQFSAAGLKQELPLDPDGLAKYLANDPAFHGIGPEKARHIANSFGADFDAVIRHDPQRVARVAHLTLAVVETLQTEWLKRTEMNILGAWLGAFGLTHRQITRLVEELGDTTKAVLQENPYMLCSLLSGFGFARVDEIALKMGVAKEHPARIAAAFRHQLSKAEQEGHCWVEEEMLLREALKTLCLDSLDAHLQLDEQLEREIAEGRLFRYDGGGRWVVALQKLAERELAIIRTFLRERQLIDETDVDWDALMTATAPDLNESQRRAALMTCKHRLSLIAGAAGSGKSYTIAAIYRTFGQVWDEVVLAAPTGKAAKRLEQLCGTEAKTIHRLLEYKSISWGRTRENPIEADVLIVDEVSMCDVHLLWHLLDAIDFTKTRLILVGDPNQLPPIGPGNILRDLLAREVLATTVLDQVVRQAGQLKENCNAILHGQVCETADGIAGTLRPWYLLNDCRSEGMVIDTLEELVREILPRLGIDPVRDVQVLTPTNKGPLGTRALNIRLQQIIQEQRYGIEVPVVSEHRRPELYVGDKVMQVRNNYDLDLMNGAIGVVKDVLIEEQSGKRVEMLLLDIEGRAVKIPRHFDEANELMLAYASTVHKCQGSEFPVIIAIVHRGQSFMLNRNLLYTAVTRAQQSAILLGDRVGIGRAIDKRDVDARKTFLSLARLEDLLPQGDA